MSPVKLIIILIVSLLTSISALSQDDEWHTNGPSVSRITEIVNFPGNNQNLYIGTVSDGIYSSLNYGDSWDKLDAEILPHNIRVIKFNPIAPDTMYVTTTLGLYKSIDNGRTFSWVILPNSYRGEIRGFELMPYHPEILFCGGFEFNFLSTNSGVNWERIADLDYLYAQRFKADPIDSDMVYCLTQSGYYSKTLFKSGDLGANWACIHNDMDTTLVAYDFDIDRIDNKNIYISGGDPENDNASCLACTDNGGVNWSDITPPNLDVKLMECVAVSPTEHNTIYAGSVANGLFKSINKGATWENLNLRSRNEHIYDIFIDPVTGAVFVSVLFDGLYRSIDEGLNWQRISDNINNAACQGISLYPANSNKLIVPTVKKLFLSNDSGTSWSEIDIDLPVVSYHFPTNIVFDPLNPDDIYGAYADFWGCSPNGIFKSIDGGANWTFSHAGFAQDMFPIKVAISNSNDNRKRLFLLSKHGAYYSDNSGDNWAFLINGLPVDSYFKTISVSEIDPNLIFTGTREGSLYRSLDGGDSWNELEHNLPGLYFNQVLCDPIDRSIVYASKENAGLFKSIDTGTTWVDITNNIELSPDCITLSGLAINPLNNQNLLVISYKKGAFISYDGGDNWSSYSNGLDTTFNLGHTIFNPLDTTKIYLATSSHSVWSITRTGTGIDDDHEGLPNVFELTTYPNPFNSAANISFSLPQAGQVSGDIYDLLGRHVATVIDDYLSPGYHSLIWTPEGISSGQYYLRVRQGDDEFSRGLLYLK